MSASNFTTTILVDQKPSEVFKAINNVRGWWSEEVEGNTEKVNDVFDYHYEDVHRAKIKLTEVIPYKKVVWFVMENYFKFTKDKSEWTDSTISFDISEKNDKTEVRFTHIGLSDELECFSICSNAWTHYIQKSLYDLITTGQGSSNGKDKPSTDHEKELALTVK